MTNEQAQHIASTNRVHLSTVVEAYIGYATDDLTATTNALSHLDYDVVYRVQMAIMALHDEQH